MKLDRLETHDRLLELQKQADNISQGCQDCINARPKEFGSHPFYIFAHKRELGVDEKFSIMMNGGYRGMGDVPTHRLIWVPRLKKPSAQTNSMLFKYYPSEDLINVLWIIPAPELWDQYSEDKMCENKVVMESIHMFKTDKLKLEQDEKDDLSDKEIEKIYKQIATTKKKKILL
jgi:hypothetical protein